MKWESWARRIVALEVQVRESGRALRLQHRETGRRLKELNNENARLRIFQSQVPSVDAFNALADRVALLEGSQKEYAGRRETQTETTGRARYWWNLAAALALAVGGIAAAYVLRQP